VITKPLTAEQVRRFERIIIEDKKISEEFAAQLEGVGDDIASAEWKSRSHTMQYILDRLELLDNENNPLQRIFDEIESWEDEKA
jgi:hypothetical protein